MAPYNLKWMSEAGYIMGLPTIGEVANHMTSHYDAYFLIEDFSQQLLDFENMYSGHEEESIFKYLTPEDKKRIDDELEETWSTPPAPEGVPMP